MRKVATWFVAVAAGLMAACGGGGGGGGSGGTPPAWNSGEAPVVLGQTGPGDVSNYFPLGVGDSWTYRVTGSGAWAGMWQDTVSVIGTTTIGGAEAYIVAESNAGGDGPTGNFYYVKDPNGIAIVGADDPAERLLLPRWELRFPVEVGSQFVELDRRNLDVGIDIDGDGHGDPMDVFLTVRVAAIESVDCPAGRFSNAARIEVSGNVKFHLSRTAEVVDEALTDTIWLAPNVGVVRQLSTLNVFGSLSTHDMCLESASVGGVFIGSTTPAPTPAPVPPAAQLSSITVDSGSVILAPGESSQLTAIGHYSDGSASDMTTQVSWSSSDMSKVTVSSAGLVTAVDSGTATITATAGGISGTTGVTVFQPTPSPVPPLSQSVAYQIDYAHSGRAVFANPPVFPDSPAWSATLNGQISYPLIAGGRVFVTTSAPLTGSGYGTSLYALDLQTGAVAWGPISIPGTYFWSGHAYDNGKLFVINFDGVLRAFDAASGALIWTTSMPNQSGFTSPPTALNGIVYVGGNGTLRAIDGATGNTLWTAGIVGGDNSSPAASVVGVFVSYPCHVYGFSPVSGVLLWHNSSGCVGGGGRTPALAFGKLYMRDWTTTPDGKIFDATSGAMMGTFRAGPIPAFSARAALYVDAGILTAVDAETDSLLWSFAGDGPLVSAPIVINDAVVVGSGSGRVYALNATTGSLLWTAETGATISGPDEQNASAPLTGFGAGEGYLVVPAGDKLMVWRISNP